VISAAGCAKPSTACYPALMKQVWRRKDVRWVEASTAEEVKQGASKARICKKAGLQACGGVCIPVYLVQIPMYPYTHSAFTEPGSPLLLHVKSHLKNEIVFLGGNLT